MDFHWITTEQHSGLQDHEEPQSRFLWSRLSRGTRGFEKESRSEDLSCEFYSFFKKAPFEQETALHNELARSALHVVGIEDAFKAK